jgi:ABC-2 type transport system permease protein
MSNILAIAQKEIRSYFASPIAYVVTGLFALLFGIFFVALLYWFVRQGMLGGMGMQAAPLNLNQHLVRPLLLNNIVLYLFMLPMITMRMYAEEKRSGTIELLLTSPITDMQIIVGKFLGALVLYAATLAVTLLYFTILFFYGNPEWKPIATAYLGLILMGGCFISVGMLISSFTRNQIVAGMLTFGVFLVLWVIDWMAPTLGPTGEKIVEYLSITRHFEDFAKGVIDTTHLIYYVSFITFGLFLTAKSVDSERWRG